MKKILFVNPSLRLHSSTKFLPVGVACVMTYLKDMGIDFDLLDVDIKDLENDDIESFLDMKKNHGDENARARDLFYALWIPDLFMKRVRDNKEWKLKKTIIYHQIILLVLIINVIFFAKPIAKMRFLNL